MAYFSPRNSRLSLEPLTEILPPMITRYIVDDALVPANGITIGMADRLSLLGWFVLGLVGVRVLGWGAEWVHGWTVTWLGARVTADIRSRLYRQLELLSLPVLRQAAGWRRNVACDKRTPAGCRIFSWMACPI